MHKLSSEARDRLGAWLSEEQGRTWEWWSLSRNSVRLELSASDVGAFSAECRTLEDACIAALDKAEGL